jgi:chromosome segregation ATPase
MSTRKTQIREHQEAVDELGLSVERQKGELGRVLLENETIDKSQIQEPYQDAEETRKKLRELEQDRNRLKEALDGKIDTSDRIKELEEEEKEYQRTRGELLVEIGRKGWDLFENESLAEEEYRPYFSELIEQAREVEERERRVRDLEAEREKSSFIRKISITAKITLARNQIGRIEGAMEQKFSTAGEALVDSGKVGEIPDEEMQRYTSRLKDIEEKSEEREREVEKLQQDLGDFEAEIEKIAGEMSAEKKLKSLESELSSWQETHFLRLQKLGDVYLHRPELHDGGVHEIKVILDRIQDLESQKQKHQDQIHVLQALIEKDDLEEQIKRKEESISKLEKRVQEQKNEIKSLKGEISSDKNRLADLNQIVSQSGAEQESSSAAGESAEEPSGETSGGQTGKTDAESDGPTSEETEKT